MQYYKIRGRPVDKMSDPISTYKRHYIMHEFTPEILGKTVDHTPEMLCQIKGIAKNEQVKVDLCSPSLAAVLDNYVTTSKADFVFIDPARSEFFKAPKVKITPKPERDPKKIFEEDFFRFRFLDRTVPRHIETGAHGGKITEQMSAYRSPWGKNYMNPTPVYNDAVHPRLTKGEVVKVPAMYQTDNIHYGSKISPNAYV